MVRAKIIPIAIIAIISIMVSTINKTSAQEAGCTDPLGTNYNSEALFNDGSCLYPVTTLYPDQLAELPPEIRETSGLMWHGGYVWTHNDSGWPPELFQMDAVSGQVIKSVLLSNGANVDWEDLCTDEHHLYIGDFGNNVGNRIDLTIYKVPLDALDHPTVVGDKIEFSYPDQVDFQANSLNHNFDMEAMVAMGDSLFLFSKNWENLQTRLYRLPKDEGSYVADLIDSFDVNGLITGAVFYEPDSLIVLTGYSRLLSPFIWLLWDFKEHRVFSGNRRRIELTIPFHQVEAIAQTDDTLEFFITNERFSNIITIPPKLHRFSLLQWIYPEPVSTSIEKTTHSFSIYPNPASDSLFVQFHIPIIDQIQIRVIDFNGNTRLILDTDSDKEVFQLPIYNLPNGPYYVQIINRDGFQAKKFIKTSP